MSTPHPRLQTLLSAPTLAVVVPLFVCTALNGVVRPWLAGTLGGTLVRSGAAVRGPDRWWTFDAATQAEHPALTSFLALSDGALGMLTFAIIAILLLGLWALSLLRRRNAKR